VWGLTGWLKTDEEGSSSVYSKGHPKRLGGRRLRRPMAIALTAIASVLVGLLVADIALALYMASITSQLPDAHVDPTAAMERTTVVYAADGSVLATWHGEQDRTVVAYNQLPKSLRDAVVAAEDQRFYEHHGFDVEAIARALGVNSRAGSVEQGGSTITQQVVKLLFTDGKRSLARKVKEAVMANALELRYPKSEVLALYLNTVYFGRGYYGAEAASQHYFGIGTSGLTLSQSATLAGIIRSPNRLNPVDNIELARQRRNIVLRQMVEQHYITQDQADEAKKEPLNVTPTQQAGDRAPFFVEYVKQTLLERLGPEQVYRGGMRVYTTLDPRLQQMAERSAKQLSRKDDPEVALVSIRHADGAIQAMVGGRDFSRNQYNLAVLGRRQPGSAFKPFVLATALEKGIKPSTRFSAAPYSVKVKDGVWNVQNYENKITAGNLSLRAATRYSVNAVYARLIMLIGPKSVVATAKKMGITTQLQPDPAIALGGLRTGVSPLEMASAYGTIANGGMAVAPTGIVRVVDGEGRTVLTPRAHPVRAISRSTAAVEADILHDVIAGGTANRARIGRWAAGKTGTTQSYRDAWFVGFSGDLVTSVWVGHRAGQVAMTNVHGIHVTGGSFPARIWAGYMRPAVAAVAERVSAQADADSMVTVKLCADTMLLANPRCPRVLELSFTPGDVPKKICTQH